MGLSPNIVDIKKNPLTIGLFRAICAICDRDDTGGPLEPGPFTWDKVFPYLVAACRPYLGTNTGQKVEIMLAEDDYTVIEIKGLSKQHK